MIELSRCFDWSKHEMVSVIGSGGKSSLIDYLARTSSNEKVLISTTTKILMPKKVEYDILWLNPYCRDEKLLAGTNESLIYEQSNEQAVKLGELVEPNRLVKSGELVEVDGLVELGKFALRELGTFENDGKRIIVSGDEILEDGVLKLQMPKKSEFQKSFDRFDKVLLESDGSRGLPLKGWNDYEPVILNETTMTIGVLPISAIGKPVTKDYIHRLPLWLELIGEQEEALTFNRQRYEKVVDGQKRLVTKEDIAGMIANENGLWKKAKGKKVLFINQVEDNEQLELANEIVKLLPVDCKSKLSRIVAGSVKERRGILLYHVER